MAASLLVMAEDDRADDLPTDPQQRYQRPARTVSQIVGVMIGGAVAAMMAAIVVGMVVTSQRYRVP